MIRNFCLGVMTLVASFCLLADDASAQILNSNEGCVRCSIRDRSRPPAFWAARELLRKEQPALNMHQRFPYHAMEMSYYRRPYNAHKVNEQRYQSATLMPQRPYGNQMYSQLHKMTEEFTQAEGGADLPKDGYLEYVDWEKHRQQRLNWEYSQPGLSPDPMDVPLIVPHR